MMTDFIAVGAILSLVLIAWAARRILVGRSWPTAGPISFWSSTSARGRSYGVGLATTGSKQRG